MRTQTRRIPRAAVVALATLAGLGAVGAAGCVDRTVGPRPARASLALSVDAAAAAIPNGSVAVDVFYRRDDAASGEQVAVVTLRLRSDSLGASVPASFDPRCAREALAGQPAPCSVSVPLKVDLAACLADTRRSPAGEGCPLFATIVLRDAAGTLLARATVGPVRAVPGRPVTMPEVVLPLRSP